MPHTLRHIQTLIRSGIPLADEFDFQIDTLTPGKVRAHLPFSGRMTRPGGSIAGPILVMLADACMYALVLQDNPHHEMALTTDLTIHFLKRAAPTTLIAEGTILKSGKTLAVCDTLLYSEGDENPVAHVVGMYALPREDSVDTKKEEKEKGVKS